MKSSRIGILGYGPSETGVYEKLSGLGHLAFHLNLRELQEMDGELDLVVSYGLKELIPSNLIDLYRPVNLHISLLPFNRGSHPNFWAFAENSPTGVSIHLVDSGIDTGPVLFQQPVELDPETQTFEETYLMLRNKIEILFVQQLASLAFEGLEGQSQKGRGSFHKRSELPKEFSGWHRIINEEIQRLRVFHEFKDFGFR